jgi:hypothetical protein
MKASSEHQIRSECVDRKPKRAAEGWDGAQGKVNTATTSKGHFRGCTTMDASLEAPLIQGYKSIFKVQTKQRSRWLSGLCNKINGPHLSAYSLRLSSVKRALSWTHMTLSQIRVFGIPPISDGVPDNSFSSSALSDCSAIPWLLRQ